MGKLNNIFSKIIKWLIASGEETPGRASGKALTIFALIMSIIISHFIVIYFVQLFKVDLTDRQVTLVNSFYSTCTIIIPILYGVKAAAKSKWMVTDGDADTANKKNDDPAHAK